MEITYRKNTGGINTKENNEISTKWIQFHWPPQGRIDGNVRPEEAQHNTRKKKKEEEEDEEEEIIEM
jgi:hypothetical protein